MMTIIIIIIIIIIRRAWIYSVFHSRHLLVAMMMLRSVVNMKKKESRMFP